MFKISFLQANPSGNIDDVDLSQNLNIRAVKTQGKFGRILFVSLQTNHICMTTSRHVYIQFESNVCVESLLKDLKHVWEMAFYPFFFILCALVTFNDTRFDSLCFSCLVSKKKKNIYKGNSYLKSSLCGSSILYFFLDLQLVNVNQFFRSWGLDFIQIAMYISLQIHM